MTRADNGLTTIEIPGESPARLVGGSPGPSLFVLSKAEFADETAVSPLAAALRDEAPEGGDIMLQAMTDDDPRALIMEAGGWSVRTRKMFVSRELGNDLPEMGDVSGWRFTSMEDMGAEAFAQHLVAASEGDPFDQATPETADAQLAELVTFAGEMFDPSRWVLVSDEAGDVGMILPQQFAGEDDEGALFYLGVFRERRGAGWGRQLHAWGLRQLRDMGLGTYMGSTDEANAPMAKIFAANGCETKLIQTFFR